VKWAPTGAGIGYQITPYTIQSFDDQELNHGGEHHQHTAFNKMHASVQIVVEHSFGELKGRFPALKWLAGNDVTWSYHSVEALMILANIFQMLQDSPWEIPDFDGSDDLAQHVQEMANPLVADDIVDSTAIGSVSSAG
jgi:DDE superfamily endonuclease